MTTPASFGAELFHGRLRTDLLILPPGNPRALPAPEEAFLARLHQYCSEHIDAEAIEREDRIPDEVIETLKDLGAMSIKLPTRWGGQGLSNLCYLRALMIVNSVHASLGELLAAHQAIGLIQPLLLFGTPTQQQTFLPRCVREITAFSLTEPEVGNDPYGIHTTAVAGPDDAYTLNGSKLWTTNGVIADLLVVMAQVPPTDDADGGMTAFIVEADTPGVTVEHRSTFMGLRGLENGVIRLENVTVPAANRIGDEGAGLTVALAAQDTGRLSLPAVSAASAKWSLKVAREWAGARVQWGRAIGDLEPVAAKVAGIAATAFALEAMVEVTARCAEREDRDTGLDAELTKLFASEHSWRIADELLQLRGGRGYETASSAAARGERGIPVERHLRDVRIGRIFDGSTEALRSFLADTVLNQPVPSHDPAAAQDGYGTATGHQACVQQAATRLAGLIEQLRATSASGQHPQRQVGRLVDIASELYAMAASRTYAQALVQDQPAVVQLADAFCAQAAQRIEALFTQYDTNSDADDRALADAVFKEAHIWLEGGVIDASTDGPWIASASVSDTRPNVRRRVPRQTADGVTQSRNLDG
ncbi:acyl-CoA dehydrogenase family protein [Streptomyces sp. NPDC003023]|uniref:acyl-CoA dehydrogenase family protein n=1 Tax=Streptomyces sp. NPDC003023 TaxID=3364675 RepID=UPI0036BF1097